MDFLTGVILFVISGGYVLSFYIGFQAGKSAEFKRIQKLPGNRPK